MFKFLVTVLSIGILLCGCGGMDDEFGTLGSELRPAGFSLPPQASQVAKDIFFLGVANDMDGTPVEGYAILHPKDNAKKPADPGGGGGKPDKGPKCYDFLGAQWKTIEPYMLDPTTADMPDALWVEGVFDASVATWEIGAEADIFGDRVANTVDGYDDVSPDDKNEAMFGSIASEGTIAVTIVWGIFGGRPHNRRLVEWDMVFDDADFDWGDAALNPLVMDFQGIATHELGHAAGLADLYDIACAEETMYGYGSEGETKARDLNAGDLIGINDLY